MQVSTAEFKKGLRIVFDGSPVPRSSISST